MADSTRYRYSGGRRSPPVFNPARASLPITTTAGYSSHVPSDIHVQPVARHDYQSGAVPVTTTTYTVRQDPITRHTSLHDPNRARRSSTIDSAAKRPIIVTTKHAAPSSQTSSSARPGSPSRENYRWNNESAYLTQPASSINRARSSTRQPHSATLDDEDYRRLRERTGDDRLLGIGRHDPYRTRPGALYNNIPHHYSSIDYGDEGYEYTKPSDLARYDLDNERPGRSRRESLDRYYRPSVSVTTDLDRVYDQNERRPRGPPPTTWGLDKISHRNPAGHYDPPGLRMPAVPVAPDPARRLGHLELPMTTASERRSTSRTRPISLIQDPQTHSRHDEYYRGRDGDPALRDRDFFHDDNVAARGFGLRVEPTRVIEDSRRSTDTRYRDERRERRERRESRRDFDDREPRRRSDEDLDPIRKRDMEDRDYKPSRDARVDDDMMVPERKISKSKEAAPREDDQDSRKEKIRDKLATGLSIAAASLGLGSALKDKDTKEDKDDRVSPRRRKEDHVDRRRSDDEKSSSAIEDYVIVDSPKERDREREREHPRKDVAPEPQLDAKERHRQEAESRLSGEPAAGPSRDHSASADEGKSNPRRRRRPSSAFNPNDTAALLALKAQMTANEDEEKEKEKEKENIPSKISTVVREPSPERRGSPIDKHEVDASDATARDESRGRELVSPGHDEKQVRVVSPPRDKDDKKPIKGILKQPKQAFPEEPNPIREGVAPHKDDKTKANVPTGARWTKINRKMVNPEALTLGKERFEVRDGFVIVLRVLSKEEIQMYAAVTAELRDRRRKEMEQKDKDRDYDDDDDEERRLRNRYHHREKDDEYDDDRDRRDRDRDREREREPRDRDRDRDRDRGDRDRDRHRRHRYSDEEDDYEYNTHGHSHHRSHRDRNKDREREVVSGGSDL